MKFFIHRLSVCLFFLSFLTIAHAQKRDAPLSAQYAIEDVQWLERFIFDVHINVGALYPDSVLHQTFQNLIDSISGIQKISRVELYTSLLPVFHLINDIHLSMYLPKKQNEYVKNKGYFLLLPVRIIDNGLFVAKTKKSSIPFGARIVRINGIPDSVIIRKMQSTSPSDGDNIYSKNRIAEKNFIELFPLFFSVQKTNRVEWIRYNSLDTVSTDVPGTKKINQLLQSTESSAYTNYHKITFYRSLSTVKIDVSSFSVDNSEDYKEFLRWVFYTLYEEDIDNLIIDLRNNEGGYAERGEQLLSYLIPQETPYITSIIFKKSQMADEIFNKQSKNSPILKRMYVLSELLDMKNQPYGTYDTVFYETTQPEEFHFEGNIYVLINGLSVSTTGLFCNSLRTHRGAVFIGEPGGFTPQGTFGQAIGFKLPHSKITGYMSTIRFNSTDSSAIMTQPFVPDVLVIETQEDIVLGRDPALNRTLEIIARKQTVEEE